MPADTVAHDLRRTARTWWSRLQHGQNRDVMERLVGHAVGDRVERVYDRALHLPAQRAVVDAWGAKLAVLTEKEAGDGPKLLTEAEGGVLRIDHPKLVMEDLSGLPELPSEVNGSYLQAAEQNIFFLLGKYDEFEGDGNHTGMRDVVKYFISMVVLLSNALDVESAERGRAERLRNIGPTKQKRKSVVLHQHIDAAAVARWDAEPTLNRKALAGKVADERPDLGEWRTIYDHLPSEHQRVAWEQRARAALELLWRLGEEMTLGDPACIQAVHARQQM